MKCKSWIVCLIAMMLLLTGIVLFSPRNKGRWSAVCRVRLDQLQGEEMVNPRWLTTQYDTISNYFGRPDTKRSFGIRAGVSEAGFDLAGLRPVRNTRMIEIRFLGGESNAIQVVSTIATLELINFFQTNQPSVHVEYIDAAVATPPRPWWRRGLDSVEAAFTGYSRW